MNGAQQFQGSVSELGQPGAADGDPVTAQTLMLAIQGQVVQEFIHDHARQETHIGTAVIQDALGGRSADQSLGFLEFDDGTHILEDHITGRTLGQAVRDLLADDLVLRWIQPLCLFAGQGDGFHGEFGFVEEQSIFSGRGWLGGFVPGMGSDGLGVRGRRRSIAFPTQVTEGQLEAV
ncbi:hypothetical protein FEMY_24470 [Ferrovum myxofaciens]|uniref:Uncharacterized protein n=1 Tax=Ferrovum myxofaciens TaxID=416213 RepID=A0A149VUY7_9PROT|nr:hypothetical protein FEMY_24470 [Ferrovum myxofaciens]